MNTPRSSLGTYIFAFATAFSASQAALALSGAETGDLLFSVEGTLLKKTAHGLLLQTLSRDVERAKFALADSSSGSLLWSTEITDSFAVDDTCSEDARFVFAIGSELRALNTSTGALIWKARDLGQSIKSIECSKTGPYLVLRTQNQDFHVVNRDTGEQLWTSADGYSLGYDELYQVKKSIKDVFIGPKLIATRSVASGARQEYSAFDVATGQIAWSFVDQKDVVIRSDLKGDLLVVKKNALKSLSAKDGSQIWELPINHETPWSDVPEIILAPSHLIVGSAKVDQNGSYAGKRFTVVDQASGVVLWVTEGAREVLPYSESLVLVNEDSMVSLRVLASGETLWSYPTLAEYASLSVLADQSLIIRGGKADFIRLEPLTGQELWRSSLTPATDAEIPDNYPYGRTAAWVIGSSATQLYLTSVREYSSGCPGMSLRGLALQTGQEIWTEKKFYAPVHDGVEQDESRLFVSGGCQGFYFLKAFHK